MIRKRPADERGHRNHGWLQARHSFSFGDYRDPQNMGFRSLRVINDDIIAAGEGFGTHGHRDMEIVTYVLDGALEHRDSMGNGSVLRPGDVQRMSAGSGIMHSEFNHESEAPLRLLQIWLEPEHNGIEPGWEEKRFEVADRRGRLRLIVSPDGADGSLRMHRDCRIYASLMDVGEEAVLEIGAGRHAWVQVATGAITVNGIPLGHGDGAAISDEASLKFLGVAAAEFLVFDLD